MFRAQTSTNATNYSNYFVIVLAKWLVQVVVYYYLFNLLTNSNTPHNLMKDRGITSLIIIKYTHKSGQIIYVCVNYSSFYPTQGKVGNPLNWDGQTPSKQVEDSIIIQFLAILAVV